MLSYASVMYELPVAIAVFVCVQVLVVIGETDSGTG
jgi:hypothetical protein